VAYKQYGATHKSAENNLKDQFRLARRVTIVMSDTSRHFIMFDQRGWFYRQVSHFLDKERIRNKEKNNYQRAIFILS